MTSKLDMVKARNLGVVSVIATGVLAAGLVMTGVASQQKTVEGVDLTNVYAGNNTTFVLDNEGNLWGKGLNSVGQLGSGDFENKTEWTLVNLPEEEKVEKATIGATHGAVLTDNNHIYTFGDNRTGVFGDGTTNVSLNPKRVVASQTYSSITAGDGFVIATDSKGQLFGWGRNDKGQLGVGDKESRGIPALIPFSEGKVVSLKAGAGFAVALLEDGRVFAWGENDKGQLGVGDKTERLTPTQVTLPEPVTFINTNLTASTVVALTGEGKLYTWGANNKGQLANGPDWREQKRLDVQRVIDEKKAIETADTERKQSLIDVCITEKTEEWKKNNPPTWEQLPPTPPAPSLNDETEEPAEPEEPEEPEWGWVFPTPPSFTAECDKEVTETFQPTSTEHIVERDIVEPALTDSAVTPTHVGGALRFTHASVGALNGAAVSVDRQLYTWGSDDRGQNGNGIDDPASHTQHPVLVNEQERYLKVEVSHGWSAAVTVSEALQVWG